MTTRGAFLAPVLVPVKNCFANLPPDFVNAFLGGPDHVGTGSTILKLSWETVDGYSRSVCVGWIGGIVKSKVLRSDVIELPTELARAVGIKDHLKKIPQAFIGVHVVDALPIARQVNVEPCTSDDWEMIQLHAGAIEVELLRQMCVVNDKQVSPIWINQNTLIRIQAILPLGMDNARLIPASQIIVAPKERPPQTADQNLSSHLFYEKSRPLLVQKQIEALGNDLSDEAWVHPESMAMLEGAVISDTLLDSRVAPLVALWSQDSEITSESNDQGEPRRQQLECYVARLKASMSVKQNHIALNLGASASLGADTGAVIFLRVLKLPKSSPSSVTLFVNFARKSTEHPSMLFDSIQQAFLRWSNAIECSHVLSSGSIFRLELDNGIAVEALAHVQYEAEEDFSAEQLKGVPASALQKYTVIGGNNGHCLTMDQVSVESAAGPQKLVLSKARNWGVLTDLSVLELSRSAKSYSLLKNFVQTFMTVDALAVRVLLGTRPPGSALIHGERGSGKSTLVRAIVHELQSSSQMSATATIVECRNLRGLKMKTVKSRLNELFKQSATNAPALLVFDNLDALLPIEEESAGAANEQSRRIAELLIGLMQQCSHRIWKTTVELNASFKREWEFICKRTLGQQKKLAKRKLLETVGNAMQRKTVAIVAVARSDTSIHKVLRACSLFDRPIHVACPDAERREVLIREMLQLKVDDAILPDKDSHQVVVDPVIDFGLLSSKTEGYSLRDLSSATDRAFHQMLKRHAYSEPSKSSKVICTLRQHDFIEGIENFQPTALLGVDLFKSSVKWSDVGGLHQVRLILKDTLELPTRYAKLYDNTPIKLPAGLLLYGPPGCGKTLLASAVANECGLNFISVKGPEVLNKYIGASEEAIRDLFKRAGLAAPSILFLDEFDSIAPRRGADNTGVTDRLVNQLLTFLDGVEARKGVYVLAATSRPDMIDPALLRPGRLDKYLYCGFPNEAERLDILRVVSKGMNLSKEAAEYLSDIAKAPKSDNFTGADLQAVMYSAQLEHVHEKLEGNSPVSNLITKSHVQRSFESAKPSTSEAARREFDRMFAGFAKARNTSFSVAEADVSASSELLKSHLIHQRTALA
ncbi:hypothetical protein CCR75_000980 [Bremia lactucae]|uniref:Peroxisomal ATPase PEX1 n=1 Tax=Bremia lactucae TaxID=4779 RepID=A0A976NXM5_BRELC|nr:hypothetical protein CCR75_000980 [Bremia lactucae]